MKEIECDCGTVYRSVYKNYDSSEMGTECPSCLAKEKEEAEEEQAEFEAKHRD